MFAQAGNVYSRVTHEKAMLFLVLRFWLVAALIGALIVGFMQLSLTAEQKPGALIFMYFGHVVAAYAILIGWYSMHRYRITGQLPASMNPRGLVRDMKAFEFVIAQVRNVLLLTIISLAFLIPLTIYMAFNAPPDITPEQVQATQNQISLVALPLMAIFFSRALLVAPLAARGEEEAVRRSWRATRGHFLRLNLLQLFCLAPAFLGAGFSHTFTQMQTPATTVIGMLCDVAGAFISLALYVELAEQEYDRLIVAKA